MSCRLVFSVRPKENGRDGVGAGGWGLGVKMMDILMSSEIFSFLYFSSFFHILNHVKRESASSNSRDKGRYCLTHSYRCYRYFPNCRTVWHVNVIRLNIRVSLYCIEILFKT